LPWFGLAWLGVPWLGLSWLGLAWLGWRGPIYTQIYFIATPDSPLFTCKMMGALRRHNLFTNKRFRSILVKFWLTYSEKYWNNMITVLALRAPQDRNNKATHRDSGILKKP
jgi:hypothetical protein